MIAIERRAFPTPWSLAMFVLELSKPSGICLAALRDGRSSGYLICSRYDTVWHLMNVAVDAASAARASPARCSSACSSTADAPGEQYTLEVRPSNDAGDRAVRALRLPLRRRAARLLPRQQGGRPDHVAHRGRSGAARATRADEGAPRAGVILGVETSCDDTCAAVVDRRRRDPLERRRLAGPAARALRRRGAGDRVAPPPGAARRGGRRRAREGGLRRSTTSSRSP